MKDGASLDRQAVEKALQGTRFSVTAFKAPAKKISELGDPKKKDELVVWKVAYSRGGG
ncbi:MAG: hypothetical protein R3F20_16665 [Planctomycetota bacterium]